MRFIFNTKSKKMIKKDFLLAITFFIFLPLSLLAQVNVKGKIIDQNQKVLEFGEVVFFDDNSIAVNSVQTSLNGEFECKISKGTYTYKIFQFGSVLKEEKVNLTDNIDLGIIEVNNSKKLEEISIVKTKKLIERKVDRLVFNVENSISASGGDGMDALKVTPGLRIQNDQITMIGKSGMGVMVNDRLIQLSGDDLINYLKNLKSDDIKKIEVITNPPAKYDAQGNSGLVNIITKTAKKDSFNGAVRTSISQSQKTMGTTGLNLNYQKNKLSITSNLNYSNGARKPYQEYNLTYPTYIWDEENNKINYSNSASGGFAIDYKISNKTKIGAEYSLSNSLPLVKVMDNSFVYKRSTLALDSVIRNVSRVALKRVTNSINLYSITELDTLGRKLNFDIDYLNYNSDTDNNFNSNSFFADNTSIPDRYSSAKNSSNQDISIITSKLDFEYPTEWANLSFGTKLTFINTDSQVDYYNSTTGNYIFDTGKSNVFNYKENIQALYFSGNKKLTKKLEMILGLRGENTQTNGFSQTLNQTNKNNYFKLFPTAYLNYTINDDKTLSLNYNRRIDRPSYGNLNPFRFYSTSFNYSEGNPFLQPYFSDNIELSYTYKSSFTSLYINKKENGFDQVTYVDPTSINQIVRPLNFYNQISYGVFQGYTFTVKKVWENNSDISVFYRKTSSNISEIVPNISTWSGSFNTQNSFILDKNKKYKAELSFMYQLPSIAGSYELSSFYEINAGIKANFFANKLQLSINAVDIFKTNKRTYTQSVNNIKQEKFDYADNQLIRFSIAYNFGKKFKTTKKENSNTEEKKRIQ